MATLFPHFKLAKKLGKTEIQIDAGTVEELIEKGKSEFGEAFKEDLGTTAILVNGRNINFLKGLKTAIAKEDKVWFVVPAAGG